MLLENHQQHHHVLFEFYINWDNILPKKNPQKKLCHTFAFVLHCCIDREQNQIEENIYIDGFITYLFCFTEFRNKLCCRRMSIDGFIKHFWSYIGIRTKY